MHRAGAALGKTAAEARSMQREIVAQDVEQRHFGSSIVSETCLPFTLRDFLAMDVSPALVSADLVSRTYGPRC